MIDFEPLSKLFLLKKMRGFCENFRFSANFDLQKAKRRRSERSSIFCNKANFALRMYTPGPSNSVTIETNFSYRPLISVLVKMSGCQFFSSYDMTSCFHQFCLHPLNNNYYTFLSPVNDVYYYVRAPFGGRTTTTFLQALFSNVILPPVKKCLNFVDDLTTWFWQFWGKSVRRMLKTYWIAEVSLILSWMRASAASVKQQLIPGWVRTTQTTPAWDEL